MKATTSERTPVPVQEEMDIDFEVDWWSQLEEDHSLESEEENAYLAGGEDEGGVFAEKQRPKKKRRTPSSRHLLRLVTPATHLGSIRGDIAQLVERSSCNWVVAITGQKIHPGPSKEPSRPTTLISVGVIGISAGLVVLGKSLNKVFTSFSHLVQAQNS